MVLQHTLKCSCEVCYRLLMLCKMGTMVEYSVFGQETTVDWTIISDAKGKDCKHLYTYTCFSIIINVQLSV